jgi:hypothetical protein
MVKHYFELFHNTVKKLVSETPHNNFTTSMRQDYSYHKGIQKFQHKKVAKEPSLQPTQNRAKLTIITCVHPYRK